jgi:hypothetical protein
MREQRRESAQAAASSRPPRSARSAASDRASSDAAVALLEGIAQTLVREIEGTENPDVALTLTFLIADVMDAAEELGL